MSDLGTMRRRIAFELGRDDLVPRIRPAILAAIAYLEQERYWFNGEEVVALTTANTPTVAVPTDLLALDLLTITNGGVRTPLTKIAYETLRGISTTTLTSMPEFWAYFADQLWLYPTPNAVYTLNLSYHKKLAALELDSSTNAWMTDGEEAVRLRAEIDLLAHKGGQSGAILAERFQAAVQRLRRIGSMKQHGVRLRADDLAGSGGYNILTG